MKVEGSKFKVSATRRALCTSPSFFRNYSAYAETHAVRRVVTHSLPRVFLVRDKPQLVAHDLSRIDGKSLFACDFQNMGRRIKRERYRTINIKGEKNVGLRRNVG